MQEQKGKKNTYDDYRVIERFMGKNIINTLLPVPRLRNIHAADPRQEIHKNLAAYASAGKLITSRVKG